ncbi:MAG: outer membrane protein assembly factor BamD [Rikenellaceae bacterium]|nr:outer membrane protein assembly factor BamD [Rikenellaceae bacterium]
MKIILRNGLLLRAVCVILGSCGTYNALLKSGNSEEMYQAALRYYQEKKNEKAIALFDMVDYTYYGTPREDTIKFYTAVSYFHRGDYYSSEQLLEDFRRRFGRSPFLEEAEYLIAMGYYLQSPEPELDQTPTRMALVAFYEYLARYKNSVKEEEIQDYIAELQQKLYDKSYQNAKL